MSLLSVGVFGTSRKKQEKRVPIHPDHFNEIDREIKKHLLFEEGYGLPLGSKRRPISGDHYMLGGVHTMPIGLSSL